MNPTQNPVALRSKEMITEGLLKLMVQEPYEEITVKHILFEADVSRKTFYRNFSSKEDVLSTYIDRILYDYTTELLAKESYAFLKILDTVFDFCERHQAFLLLLRDNELLYLLLNKMNRLILEEHGKVRRGNAPFVEVRSLSEYIVTFNIGGIWNILARWLENDMQDSAEEIKKEIVYYLSHIHELDLRDL